MIAAGLYGAAGLAMLAALLAAGLALFMVLPGSAPATDRLARWVEVLAVTGFAAAYVRVLFAIMDAGGGLGGLGSGLARADVLRGGDYESALVRAVGLVTLVLALRLASGHRRLLLAAGAVVTAGSYLLTGHERSEGPAVVVALCALAHVLGAAGWFGGIVGLAATLRSVTAAQAGRLLTTFASLMTGVVIMLLAGGIGLGLLLVPSPHALVTTAYGQVLLVKIALVLGVLVLSGANHRRLVPLAGAGHARAVGVVRINVAVEQVVLLAVVLITDVLIRQNPA